METNVYINYPNCHFTIHNNPHCKRIQQHNKPNQRRITITNQQELDNFINKRHEFESKPPNNDMWLKIDLGSQEDNRIVIDRIKLKLGQHYKPFKNALIYTCCK